MADAKRTLNNLRGLAAAGDHGVRRVDSYRVDPRVLTIEEGFNVRIPGEPELRAHIDSIKGSLREFITREDPENRVSKGGLLEVIPALMIRVGEEGGIVLVDGHCRTTAIRELITEGFDIQEVDVVSTKGDEAERTVLMVRSSQAKGLAPLEKGLAFVRLVDNMGWSFPDVARAMGGTITPQRVEQLVLLGRSPSSVQQMVEDKQVTADSAIDVMRKHKDDPQAGARVLEGMIAAKGNGPVGKGQTRPSIPPKVQQRLFDALKPAIKAMNKQFKELERTEGWEEQPMNVTLPAGVVKQLLEQQAKATAAASEAAAAKA